MGCLFNLSAWIQIPYHFLLSRNRAINCVLFSFHDYVASNESNHLAAGLRKRDPKGSLFGPSYTVCLIISLVAHVLPKEKIIFFSNKRIKAVTSSLESILINITGSKSGYATVNTISYYTNLTVPCFCSICGLFKSSGSILTFSFVSLIFM